MLPIFKRLNLRIDFSRVIKGKRIETPNFIFYFNTSSGEIPKVGISIRTKNFGKAHNRNRARRITSQIIQDNYDRLPKDYDLIIMPKSGLLESGIGVLDKEVSDVLASNKIN